jgi:hypothetical protein
LLSRYLPPTTSVPPSLSSSLASSFPLALLLSRSQPPRPRPPPPRPPRPRPPRPRPGPGPRGAGGRGPPEGLGRLLIFRRWQVVFGHRGRIGGHGFVPRGG